MKAPLHRKHRSLIRSNISTIITLLKKEVAAGGSREVQSALKYALKVKSQTDDPNQVNLLNPRP